jgi:AcrR family transcriptional regulator
MTLYRHYPSKEELALAFLRRRDELWTRSWLLREVERRARAPEARLLVIFDVFDEWFHRSDFEACSFLRSLLEHAEPGDRVRKATERHLEEIRAYLRQLAKDSGLRDADDFASKWQMVMMGCILAAYAGDKNAARRAKEVARVLLTNAVRRPVPGGKG